MRGPIGCHENERLALFNWWPCVCSLEACTGASGHWNNPFRASSFYTLGRWLTESSLLLSPSRLPYVQNPACHRGRSALERDGDLVLARRAVLAHS